MEEVHQQTGEQQQVGERSEEVSGVLRDEQEQRHGEKAEQRDAGWRSEEGRGHVRFALATQATCLDERCELRGLEFRPAGRIVHPFRERADRARAAPAAPGGGRSNTASANTASAAGMHIAPSPLVMKTSIAMGERRSGGEAELRDLIERYQIAWTVRQELAVHDGTLRPIGFVVELSGTHREPKHTPTPGCEECRPLRAALERIAHAVLPDETRPSWYDVVVEAGFGFEHGRTDRPEISATISVLHRGAIDRPVDACERECVDEIGRHLSALGARRR